MNRFLPLYFLLFTAAPLAAQVPDNTDDLSEFIFSRNHLSVSIMGGIAMKAKVSTDQYGLGSSNQIAFGGGINYHSNFNRNLSLIFGLHLAAPIRNIEYNIPKDEFSPPLDYDLFHNGGISQEVAFMLRLPVTMETRFFYGQNKFWNISGGVSLNYGELHEEHSTHIVEHDNQAVNYFNTSLFTNNDNKPWLNYHFGGGHSWILRNKNLISAGLIANLSFTNFTRGNYTVEVPGKPLIEGDYSFKGSYIGFTLSYIFTGAKKRMKAYS